MCDAAVTKVRFDIRPIQPATLHDSAWWATENTAKLGDNDIVVHRDLMRP